MAKSIKELKKENVFLKSKCEKSDVTLIELVEEVSWLSFFFFPLNIFFSSLEYVCRLLPSVWVPFY